MINDNAPILDKLSYSELNALGRADMNLVTDRDLEKLLDNLKEFRTYLQNQLHAYRYYPNIESTRITWNDKLYKLPGLIWRVETELEDRRERLAKAPTAEEFQGNLDDVDEFLSHYLVA